MFTKIVSQSNMELIIEITPFIALIVSIITSASTMRLSKLQRKLLENQKLPNLNILSVETTKSKADSSTKVTDAKHCRIYEGNSMADFSLQKHMAVFESTDIGIEPGFIDELKSHIKNNKRDVYLTYFDSKPYLIIQHASNVNNFIIDHSNVKIKFCNYGAKMTAFSIESFKVYYNEERDISELFFKGDPAQKITFKPEDNDEFELFFDEVTTDLNNSMCQLPLDVYLATPDSFDILKAHSERNVLCYHKLEIVCICWDIYNMPIKYLITIEHNGNFFVSTTSLVKR